MIDWAGVQGSPISWRQLWKALILSPEVEPNVIRRRGTSSGRRGQGASALGFLGMTWTIY